MVTFFFAAITIAFFGAIVAELVDSVTGLRAAA